MPLDKLWNLSETADTPVRWPGLLGKGGGIPAAQQPGRPLWCWWEGQGALGRRKLQILWLGGHVPCLLPQGPSVLCMLGALLRAHRSAQKTPTSSEQLLTASHWPDPVSSQASLPQETPPPTRAAQDLAWCKRSPSSTPHRPCPEARLPLHAHLPLHVSSPPGWGQSHVSGAQLRCDPWRAPASISGRNKAPQAGCCTLMPVLACPQPTIYDRRAPRKSCHVGSGPLHDHLRTVPSLAPTGPWAEQAC